MDCQGQAPVHPRADECASAAPESWFDPARGMHTVQGMTSGSRHDASPSSGVIPVELT